MHIKISKIRYTGERASLLFSFFIVTFATLFVFQISIWLIIAAVVLQLIYVAVSQRQLIGNSLLLTPKQFPDIYQISKENADDLVIPMPRIFISQDPYINAFTIGFRRPYSIVLNSALVESLTRDELDFVIGHEMGHIKFGHARYLSLISPVGGDIPFISWLYAGWQRKSEYTSDRVGYVLTHRVKPAISAMIKMSVGKKLSRIVDIDELIKQIEAGRKGFLTRTGEMMLTHPYTTNRIIELVEFTRYEEKYHDKK